MGCISFLLITALFWLAPLTAVAVEVASITVSAVILSKNQCKFDTKAATLDFGQLDPLNPVVVNASTSISFTCNGADAIAAYIVGDDGGLNSYNMVHQTDPAQMIPYSLTLTPSAGTVTKKTPQAMTISGSILGVDYQSALVGLYSDTVIVDVQP